MEKRQSGRRRSGLMGVAGLAAAVALTGCGSGEIACPAIGWINELTITLDGDLSDVADVKLCIEDDCAPAEGTDIPEELTEVAFTDQDASTGTWVFTTGMSTPDQFIVRVYAADGTVLSNTQARPQWVRVGGSEQCGGPGEAALAVHI